MKAKPDWMEILGATPWALALVFLPIRTLAATVVSYETIDIPAYSDPDGYNWMRVTGVSDGGSVAVGWYRDSSSGSRVDFIWEHATLIHAIELLDLPGIVSATAQDVSADGSTIVGTFELASGYEEAYRLQDGEVTRLGFLPGATRSDASAVSADGSVIVGVSGNRAFRWENGMMTSLEALPGWGGLSEARGVSADGSVVIGYSGSVYLFCGPDENEVTLWENGTATGLGFGNVGIVAYGGNVGVSADGSVTVGTVDGRPFRRDDGVLAYLAADSGSCALSVSADGSLVTGGLDAFLSGGPGVVWSQEDNWDMVYLDTLVDEAGFDREGFELAGPITADGRTIVGYALHGPSRRLYRIRLADPVPPPSPVVAISDPNLEAAVRIALGKLDGDLTVADMGSLTTLSARGLGIADLTGLEYATNLTALDLCDNEITDVTALVELAGLDQLDLSQNCIDLTPGTFSCRVVDQLGSNGMILSVESQDAAPAGIDTERLVNLSTRGWVGSGDAVLIGGLVVAGPEDMRLLIRGIGPSLSPYGVTGVLASPVLQIYRSLEGGAAELVATVNGAGGLAENMAAEQCGAFALDPGAGDAVLCTRLPPGVYTVQLSGADGAEGIGMIEVYEVR